MVAVEQASHSGGRFVEFTHGDGDTIAGGSQSGENRLVNEQCLKRWAGKLTEKDELWAANAEAHRLACDIKGRVDHRPKNTNAGTIPARTSIIHREVRTLRRQRRQITRPSEAAMMG